MLSTPIYHSALKRANQLKWDKWFLGLAQYVSTASKDPSTKVGAVIVDENRIVRGMGYNGFPRGVDDSPERYNERELKYKLVVHAEVNACVNSIGNIKGGTIYVWPTLMVPNVCPECCKVVIQSGIRRVVGYEGPTNERWQSMAEISSMMLKEAGVAVDMVTPI